MIFQTARGAYSAPAIQGKYRLRTKNGAEHAYDRARPAPRQRNKKNALADDGTGLCGADLLSIAGQESAAVLVNHRLPVLLAASKLLV